MTLSTLIHRAVLALIAAMVEEALIRILPQPPRPPVLPFPLVIPPTEAEERAAALCAHLWERYRDPAGGPPMSSYGRHMAVLYRAVLDEDSITWLTTQIRSEFQAGPDAPPISHEVHL